MKKILQWASICSTMVLVFMMSSFSALGQTAGFNTTYIVLNVNGTDTYYDLQATTANPDFNGASFGTFCLEQSNGLVFRGAEHNVYKCDGCDLQSTRIYYRIYPAGSPSGSFISNGIGYDSGFANGCGGEDQKWSTVTYNTDLVDGLAPGNYMLEVYSDATTTCEGGTVYAANSGANYIATFTINAFVTYYADTDGDGFGNPNVYLESCTGAPAGYVADSTDCDDTIIYYVDDDGDGHGSDVFSPCPGVTNSDDCDDTLLLYADADGDGFGSGPYIACGVSNDDDCDDAMVMYLDSDGDGFGSTTMVECGGVMNSTDCDDTQETYVDGDSDGFGSAALAPCGVYNNDDCDDTRITYMDDDGDGFGTTEQVPCGVTNDDDCDDTLLLYDDTDGDGYGSGAFVACGVDNADDCDDTDEVVNPDAFEVYYNGIDDNCSGELDEGNQITSQVQPSQCGTTLANINSIIGAVSIAQVSAYRFEVTNTATNVVQVIEKAVPHFNLTMLASYDYATTYSIRVEVFRNGIWLGYYGAPCLVSTPNIVAPGGAAQVNPSQCGTTLSSISSLIATSSLAGVTGYRFRVTNLTDATAPNQVQVIDRALHWFSLPMLAAYNYGTTYSVEVAMKTNGDYTAYGSSCTITTPAVPSLANCGTTIESSKTLIYTTSLAHVSNYQFEVTNLVTNEVTIINRPVHYFSFSNMPGFSPSTQYGVRVALMVNGVFSQYGSTCTITSPDGTSRPDAIADTSMKGIEMSAVGFPNPFVDTFSISLKTGSDAMVNVKVYDMTGRLIEASSQDVSNLETFTAGSTYPSGVYTVVVSQQGETETLRMVKR